MNCRKRTSGRGPTLRATREPMVGVAAKNPHLAEAEPMPTPGFQRKPSADEIAGKS